MSKLYVCKQYDTPYDERVCAIISTLEEHDTKVRADAIDEFAEKCEKWIEKVNDIRCDNSAMLTIANIRALAEELKEQI